jgi:hypothetical protein
MSGSYTGVRPGTQKARDEPVSNSCPMLRADEFRVPGRADFALPHMRSWGGRFGPASFRAAPRLR